MAAMCKLSFLVAFLGIASAGVIITQSGEDLVLECNLTKVPTTAWKFNDQNILVDKIQGSGANIQTFIERKKVTDENSGQYVCTDDNGVVVSSYSVTVVTVTGSNVTFEGNHTVPQFSCGVGNLNLNISSIVWRRGDLEISNSSEKYRYQANNNESILVIQDLNTTDAGLYTCVINIAGQAQSLEHKFSLNVKPEVSQFEKLRNRVEDEVATIECKVTGFPVPDIKWYRKLEGSENFEVVAYDTRVNTTANSHNVPNATLVIRELKIKTDRGEYMCEAINILGSSNSTVSLKVKDKLAAVWPFLGICAEVAILCSIIFIFEKRRSRKMEEEEEVDAVKQDLMSHANGDNEDQELRQRTNVAKA